MGKILESGLNSGKEVRIIWSENGWEISLPRHAVCVLKLILIFYNTS